VRAYVDFMKKYNPGVDLNDWSNVIAYYMGSAVVQALKSCSAELTREQLLDRVSHMEEVAVPMLIRHHAQHHPDRLPRDQADAAEAVRRLALDPARRHY
jgi:hypothetical protein